MAPTNKEFNDGGKSETMSYESERNEKGEEPVQKDNKGSSEPEFITGMRLLLVMGSVTLVSFLIMLDSSIIVTAIPRITEQFHSLPDLGWYGSAYQLANAAVQPLTGKVYQYFSSKWAFLAFFSVFEIGSLICGLASSSKMLIVGRGIAGLGASGLQNGAFTIIAGSAPMSKRPTLLGIMMGFVQMGPVLGPVLGGALTEYATWRWCFYINLPVGAIAAALLVLIHIPDQMPKGKASTVVRTAWHKLDVVGFLLFSPAGIMFLLALEYANSQYSWNSSTVIGLLCGAGSILVVFLFWEKRAGNDALIPFSMVSKRVVWSSCLAAFFMMGAAFTATYYLPIYFQTVRGHSPLRSAVDLLPAILTQTVFGVLSGLLVGKLGYYLPWIVFASVATSIAHGLITTFTPATPGGDWIGYLVLLGIGRGAGFSMPIVAIQNTLPQTEVSIGMSLVVFSLTFGTAIFLTVANTIFASSLRYQLAKNLPSADPQVIIDAGASAATKVVSAKDLASVLLAYSTAINHVFYLAVGGSVACFVFGLGMGWKDVRLKKKVTDV